MFFGDFFASCQRTLEGLSQHLLLNMKDWSPFTTRTEEALDHHTPKTPFSPLRSKNESFRLKDASQSLELSIADRHEIFVLDVKRHPIIFIYTNNLTEEKTIAIFGGPIHFNAHDSEFSANLRAILDNIRKEYSIVSSPTHQYFYSEEDSIEVVKEDFMQMCKETLKLNNLIVETLLLRLHQCDLTQSLANNILQKISSGFDCVLSGASDNQTLLIEVNEDNSIKIFLAGSFPSIFDYKSRLYQTAKKPFVEYSYSITMTPSRYDDKTVEIYHATPDVKSEKFKPLQSRSSNNLHAGKSTARRLPFCSPGTSP